jgi:hypothetical protein
MGQVLLSINTWIYTMNVPLIDGKYIYIEPAVPAEFEDLFMGLKNGHTVKARFIFTKNDGERFEGPAKHFSLDGSAKALEYLVKE